MGQTLDLKTANEEVLIWLDNVAHQRIHDTTKQKPAERLVEERQALQTLPPEIVPAPPLKVKDNIFPSSRALSQQPLHHHLSVYDQLVEEI